jgi:hypothetical protein
MALITPERATQLVPQLAKISSAQLTVYLGAASNMIEAACGRKFAFAEVIDEVVRADVYGRAWLVRTPVTSGSLSLKDLEGNDVSRWRLDTESGELEAPSYPNRILLASYEGGFETLPLELEMAVATFARYRSDRDQVISAGEITSKEIGSVKIGYGSASGATATGSIPKSIMDGISHLIMPSLV